LLVSPGREEMDTHFVCLPRPMDRVVCGDVGFGKTEVAMRAAQGGCQVAVLVPTTLLAEQHDHNFADRLADWPVRVESLSRFRSPKEQKQVIEGPEKGAVDIVIGTHKLLQGGIRFKDLGLVIIDEEHRFGVRHKERLKALRSEVDILTLTATPHPAHAQHAHVRPAGPLGHRHPARRAPPHQDLYQPVERRPERFSLLVCTTIIESGIDVPTANTILINRADKLGLAQLHQPRGRGGRSHHRAYAYLLRP